MKQIKTHSIESLVSMSERELVELLKCSGKMVDIDNMIKRRILARSYSGLLRQKIQHKRRIMSFRADSAWAQIEM